jgi:hypothetical protein
VNFDLESTRPNQPSAAAPASTPRAARPLGRGLEDVSHLFVPQGANTPAADTAKDRPQEPAPVPPPARAGAAVLRPGHAIARDHLLATLKEWPGALEENMRAIDVRVPCTSDDAIDLLALDRSRQLTIVDVETSSAEPLLLRGLSHLDWVVRHAPLVERMYPGWAIDATRPPRLILVAPAFSRRMRGAIRQLAGCGVAGYRCHSVELSGGTGVFFERMQEDGD